MSAAILATTTQPSIFPMRRQPLVALALQNTAVAAANPPLLQTQVLGKGADSAFGCGGFLGYNTQWQDLITRRRSELYAYIVERDGAPHPGRRGRPLLSARFQRFPRRHRYRYQRGAPQCQRALDLTDYAEARFRAGYIVGNLLPYGFVGFVVGRAEYSVSATTDAICTAQVSASAISTGECLVFPYAQRRAK